MLHTEILVIATSAPEKRPAYRRDLLSCLCYPPGVSVLFSYRRRWIESALLDQYLRRPNKLIKIPILVMFCDIPKNPKRDNFSFIPLRYAQFEGFEPEELLSDGNPDTNIAVRFKLSHFVNLSQKVKEQLQNWQTWVLDQEDKYPRPFEHFEADKACLVFKGKHFQEQDEKRNEAIIWTKLAEQLITTQTLKRCCFFRVSSIQDASGKEIEPTREKQYKLREVRTFESGKSYRINLQFFLEPGKGSFSKTLTPSVSTESIQLSQPLIENIGRSTTATIIVNCSRVYFSEFATLVIEDSEDKKQNTARAEFIISLRQSRWILPFIIGLLFIGTFSSSLTSDSIKEIVQEDSVLAKNAAGIEFLLKALGSFLVGLGAYLGFRKIPEK